MILCYDVETDGLDTTRCRLACAVTCAFPSMRCHVFGPRRIGELAATLKTFPRSGHNIHAFDDKVVERLSRSTLATPSWDLLARIRDANNGDCGGFRLEKIAAAMLGLQYRTHMSGRDVPTLIRGGMWHDVIEHCLQDVQIYAHLIRRILYTGGVVTNGEKTVRVDIKELRAWANG